VTTGRVLKKFVSINGITRRFAWREIDGLVVFSHNSSYRKVWGITDPNLRAHHLIPKEFWNNPFVQKAAKADVNSLPSGVDPFHMNMPHNGLGVDISRHSGSHPTYSAILEDRMDNWVTNHPNATNEQAAVAMYNWQSSIRNIIDNSSTSVNSFGPADIPPIPNP
jgi:hypothetical protein